jgi:hypothetical protein
MQWVLKFGSAGAVSRHSGGWQDTLGHSHRDPAYPGALNEGRDTRDGITYDSLWIHAKRHYSLAGIAAYWRARMDKELRNALADNAV